LALGDSSSGVGLNRDGGVVSAFEDPGSDVACCACSFNSMSTVVDGSSGSRDNLLEVDGRNP
jgi:hypothetical protein